MSFLRSARGASTVVVLVLALAFASSCIDQDPVSLAGPSANMEAGRGGPPDVAAAIAAQNRHTPALMKIPGVVGTAVGLNAAGQAVVRIFVSRPDIPGLPDVLDGVAVERATTGLLMAFSNPTLKARPAPLGYSVGHPLITAGTIGARVKNAGGQLFILSNNHVLANSNDAVIGDPTLQPGPYDGGTSADQVGTLSAFRTINFSGGNNTFDAAIALTTAAETGNATPLDDGYGVPSHVIHHDGNGDGVFDDVAGLLGTSVQKFGRTTKLTHGQITGINATLSICYEVLFIFCVKSATYVDQLIIGTAGFSDGGDSGSLIVTDNTGVHPVGLLFAGSSTQTIANRIDLVLNYFGVTIDDGSGTTPPPLTDAAISSVGAPASVTQGNTVNVTVTVQNVGNQAINTPFSVSLQDATALVSVGTQNISGLVAGASTTLTFSWNTTGASLGNHTLTASHNLTDDNSANNQGSAVSMVSAPGGGGSTIHIGDLDAFPSNDGSTWSATVEITVHDANHAPLNGAKVVGTWSRNGLNANTCTSGDLGGDGTCIVLFPGLRAKSVSFTVSSVTMAGKTYVATSNHDPDGSSNGTTIKVSKP